MVYDSHLNSLVRNITRQLSRAEIACSTITSSQGSEHACQPLAQLQQAIKDGKDAVERDYDHILSHHPNKHSSKGDQRPYNDLSNAYHTLEAEIVEPLESIARHTQSHENHHHHHHTHHHCHCQHHHRGGCYYQITEAGIVRYHPQNHDHHRHSSDWKFETMSQVWEAVHDDISDCFDELEARLEKDDKGSGGGPGDGSKSPKPGHSHKGNETSESAKDIMKVAQKVEEDLDWMDMARDKLQHIGNRYRSRSSSCCS